MTCSICLEDGNVTWGSGRVHVNNPAPNLLCQPVHKECFSAWVENKGAICHICKRAVYWSSIYSWRDKIIPVGKSMFKSGTIGWIIQGSVGWNRYNLGIGIVSGMGVDVFPRIVKAALSAAGLRQLREATGTMVGGIVAILGSTILQARYLGGEGSFNRMRKELSTFNPTDKNAALPVVILGTIAACYLGASIGGEIGDRNNRTLIGIIHGISIGLIGTFLVDMSAPPETILITASIGGIIGTLNNYLQRYI